ncbi:MAG: DUF58 domain-containing protein, partial [Verrucomicrobiota bacterium]
LDPKVLGRLMGLPLNARHAMLGSVSGRHRSPIHGSSLEFAEYREYVPGDDTRRLDWRAWGRSDRYFIKEFEADTNLRMCFIVDASGSMNFGPEGETRLDYARRLVGTLGYLAAHQGDAVGLFSSKSEGIDAEIPARRGPVHLSVVLDRIASLGADGEADMVETIHQAAEKISQRALIIIVSDLFFPPDDLQEAFQHLRFRKHDVSLFHLLRDEEVSFDFDRPMRFLDMEGGAPALADPSLIAKNYRSAMQKHLAEVGKICSRTGVDYHRVMMETPYDEALARFLLGRNPRNKKSAANVG